MAELNSSFKPPPYRVLPIIGRSVLIYKLWHEILDHISKKSRYTLGTKIDLLFIETLELLFIASYLSKQAKLPYLQKAVAKLDLLKFFLQISWEIKAMDTKKYISLSEKLDEIGKMLGGWIRGISIKENSAGKGGEWSEFRGRGRRSLELKSFASLLKFRFQRLPLKLRYATLRLPFESSQTIVRNAVNSTAL